MDKDLEQYILQNISPEGEVLEELYRKTYTSVLNPNMISGHLQGKILEMIVNMVAPLSILEIGTYTGYSAICMARALPPNGSLHTIEVNDELSEMSKSFIERAGLSKRIIMHTGDANNIIPGLDMLFDLVFIDGDKSEYPEYYRLVIDKIRSGGYILADNVLWSGKVIDKAMDDPMTEGIRQFNNIVQEDEQVQNVLLPVRDGLMVVRKL